MARFLSLCLALLLGACTSQDAAPIFMDMAYQVRCLTCEPRAPDDPKRDIRLLDGEDGHGVRCRISKRSGKRFVTFSVTYIDEMLSSRSYALEVFEANIDDNNPGNTCEVTVQEGNNTYEGGCTSKAPDEDATCQLTFEEDGNILNGTLLCLDIVNQVNTTTTRRVVMPGTKDDPAEFAIHNCEGL